MPTKSTKTTPSNSRLKAQAAPKAAKPAQASDWRAETLEHIRAIIQQVDPDIIEEVKWRKPTNPAGVPVWSHNGIICTGETYKGVVKMTFAKGASLPDPVGLFNSSLEGNTRRAIDIREGDKINERALKALIRAAIDLNSGGKTSAKPAKTKATMSPKPSGKAAPASESKKPKLLSGGNPQIAKAEGDAPVQAYIDAIPGWKQDIARRLDALVTRTVPNVHKAVKWNSPFYGIKGQGWFLGYHVFTNYLKVTFFKGTSLKPAPLGGTAKEARWIDIHENDYDEAQLKAWIKQAAAIPGWGNN